MVVVPTVKPPSKKSCAPRPTHALKPSSFARILALRLLARLAPLPVTVKEVRPPLRWRTEVPLAVIPPSVALALAVIVKLPVVAMATVVEERMFAEWTVLSMTHVWEIAPKQERMLVCADSKLDRLAAFVRVPVVEKVLAHVLPLNPMLTLMVTLLMLPVKLTAPTLKPLLSRWTAVTSRSDAVVRPANIVFIPEKRLFEMPLPLVTPIVNDVRPPLRVMVEVPVAARPASVAPADAVMVKPPLVLMATVVELASVAPAT